MSWAAHPSRWRGNLLTRQRAYNKRKNADVVGRHPHTRSLTPTITPELKEIEISQGDTKVIKKENSMFTSWTAVVSSRVSFALCTGIWRQSMSSSSTTFGYATLHMKNLWLKNLLLKWDYLVRRHQYGTIHFTWRSNCSDNQVRIKIHLRCINWIYCT